MKRRISNQISSSTGLVAVISAAIVSSMVTSLIPGYTFATPASSTNQLGTQIDSAIAAIQAGNTDEGRKQLLQSEKLLEDMPSAGTAEKHIEAALQALKQGDNGGSITHAEEAKNTLM